MQSGQFSVKSHFEEKACLIRHSNVTTYLEKDAQSTVAADSEILQPTRGQFDAG